MFLNVHDFFCAFDFSGSCYRLSFWEIKANWGEQKQHVPRPNFLSPLEYNFFFFFFLHKKHPLFIIK